MNTDDTSAKKRRSPRPANLLTKDDVRALLRACPENPTGIRDRALITVMYHSGIRVGEALALREDDVDPAAATVHAGNRTVAIGRNAMAVLERWIGERRELGISGGPLFCTSYGGPMSDVHVRGMMTRLAHKAGLNEPASPEALRNTHTRELVEAGTPIEVIRDRLGQKSAVITGHYLGRVAADVGRRQGRRGGTSPRQRRRPNGAAVAASEN